LKAKILNIEILDIAKNDFLQLYRGGFLLTPNVDHLVKLQSDEEFFKVYKAADYVICDSKIVLHASKYLGQRIREVIPGSTFFTDFYKFHSSNPEIRIFLLGARPGVAEQAKERINDRVGREIVVGTFSPPFGMENDTDLLNQIEKSVLETNASVLVVGMGAPKQEKWIYEHRHRFERVKYFMPLGATIDFEAGSVKRAPLVFQKLSLEWLFRLLMEPKRLFLRYFKDLIFFKYVIQQKYGKYNNPFEKL
jgi:N-acetylglucosaminyldiphosphoundecaprenol N-acetyl-beta-D-mannosaminyltransferase